MLLPRLDQFLRNPLFINITEISHYEERKLYVWDTGKHTCLILYKSNIAIKLY
jgi:hypothetical protein